MADGAYLCLPPGAALTTPVQLLFITGDSDLAIQPRNLIVAGADSRASIVEHHVGLDGQPLPHQCADPHRRRRRRPHRARQAAAGKPGRLAHRRACGARQGADTRFSLRLDRARRRAWRASASTSASKPKAPAANSTASTSPTAASIPTTTRASTTCKPGATSREYLPRRHGRRLARRVQRQGGRASRRPAKRRLPGQPQPAAVGQRRSRHQAQLEIYADDVKCGHGATVGQLDPDQVFYLRSRGLDAASARALLTMAFARDVIDRIRITSLRQRVEQLVERRLPALQGA